MSQWRRRYVSHETLNDVSVERRQDVSVVRLHDVLFVCCDDVSRGRTHEVSSVRLHDVSDKSQMKHPTTSQWCLSTTSPVTPIWNTQKRRCGTAPPPPRVTLSRRLVPTTVSTTFSNYFVQTSSLWFFTSYLNIKSNTIFSSTHQEGKRGVVWIIN